MSGGFIDGMWYEENTYNEKIEDKQEQVRLYEIEKSEVIEKIIQQKIFKSGVSTKPTVQRSRLNERSLDNLKVILNKWESI